MNNSNNALQKIESFQGKKVKIENVFFEEFQGEVVEVVHSTAEVIMKSEKGWLVIPSHLVPCISQNICEI